ncbi:Multiple resistance and pH regulation protein F (modular protein) [Nostocoides japonicum T1-X7]|uniref:Multiple resistance and pH regulation protein F (Modular protein) n=1 Tax=Nostocoides japonicum T1-X7 TaxID=1194083 RepID=A0A077LYI9_9MICO|nr:monovalent cation/H+ antiporter complex subunit F [Tetrasphaera japonica]CCH77044.1 Multiple resistance and pH regulation protein F (modular protein) [Tetrasphaera japonica T1-X7]
MSAFAWVVAVTGAFLSVAAVLAAVRIARGPSMPDRAVALDTLVAVFIAGLGAEAAYNRHASTLPVLVVLSLVGVVGSVSVARYATGRESAAPVGESAEPVGEPARSAGELAEPAGGSAEPAGETETADSTSEEDRS